MKEVSRQIRSLTIVMKTGREVVGTKRRWWQCQIQSPWGCVFYHSRGKAASSSSLLLFLHIYKWGVQNEGWAGRVAQPVWDGAHPFLQVQRNLQNTQTFTDLWQYHCEPLRLPRETPVSRLFWCVCYMLTCGGYGILQKGSWASCSGSKKTFW